MEMNQIKQIQEYLKSVDAVIISAGAGIGVDSGLPDFRGSDGFWRAYPLLKRLKISFEEMANPYWFENDPYLAWAFYGHRLNLYRDTTPHEGFKLLQEYCKRFEKEYFVFTSNVDGQFQKSGFDTDKIYEVHGSIHYLQCTQNCTDSIWQNKEKIEVDIDSFKALNIPLCPKCKAVARPNILMFGDWGWNSIRTNKQAKRYNEFLHKNYHKDIAIIEIGAGKAVPTVRYESKKITQNFSSKLIRINPRDYDLEGCNGWSIATGAIEGLKAILP